MMAAALTIAGSDPSGGAGLQADLKTFHQHRVYGMSAVTLLTVQNTRGVHAVRLLEPDFVAAQIDAVIGDIPPSAAKTGALGCAEIVEIVAARAGSFPFPLVVDPVMISKHGDSLIDERAVASIRRVLLPVAFLVTPNRHEAFALTGIAVNGETSAEKAVRAIASMGARNVLVKNIPHGEQVSDLLYTDGAIRWFRAARINTGNTHGSGCVLAAAIAARLALGRPLSLAIEGARAFVRRAIREGFAIGTGVGPANTMVDAE